eukprot:TRINITY_DN2667_c0_g1_i1.p2 TRINITY_DN2667_c0_g1~~TRINITY_DN2667_c0_g1_i1.p2  ORF type:complete len:182 (-),score=39.49 TRINITY_DN2667_c0_g1_i1:1252-1797(-)
MADPQELAKEETFFIENVEEFMSSNGEPADVVLEKLQNEYRKLKQTEARLVEQKDVIKQKLPDIKRALEIVNHLKSQQDSKTPVITHFEVTNHIWAEAEVKPQTKSVYLWLGANVMVECPFDEALELLTNNLTQGQKALEQYSVDLDYLKDQITVTEVNIARVYNWDVKERRKKQQSQTSS